MREPYKPLKRTLDLPKKSFFLFGPRGTGKSTLVQMKLDADLKINLLESRQYIPLSQNPSFIREWTQHLKAGQWVFVDEVQKIPALLDEIHALYEEKRLHFALSGSSARKLKRGGANLLAGRALQTYLLPLTHEEYGNKTSFEDAVNWGTLPEIVMNPSDRVDTLATYVETYLRQELIEEGLIRKLDPFIRFLQVAGLYNAQVMNVENIAREAHVKRTTVDKYFEILEDTLIGFRLPAIVLGLQQKETSHPKFYFFDTGVARACSGLLFDTVESSWKGFSFETYVLHELRAYNSYRKKHRNFYYYRVSGGMEIDLLIELTKKTLSKPREFLAIEIKYTTKWDSRWSKAMSNVAALPKSGIKKCIGVYTGQRILTQNGVTIFPIGEFLRRLYRGEIF